MKLFYTALIVLLSLSINPFYKAYASGGEDWSFEYATYYLTQFFKDQKMYPLQLAPTGYYGDFENNSLAGNATAWRNQLNIPLTIDDSLIEQAIYSIAQSGGATSKVNIGIKPYFDRASVNIKNYWKMLGQYIVLSDRSKNEWGDYQEQSYKSVNELKSIITAAEASIESNEEDFIRWRYMHLLLRAYHIHQHYDLARKAFEKYYPKLNKNGNVEQWWCEGLAAGAYYRTKKNDLACYYSARAWMNTADGGTAYVTTFKWAFQDVASILRRCTSKADSICVISLAAYNGAFEPFEAPLLLQAMGASDDIVRVLFMRETELTESSLHLAETESVFFDSETLVSSYFSKFNSKNTFNRYKSLQQKLYEGAAPNDKAFYVNALAYLLLKSKEYDAAKQQIDLAQSLATKKIDITQNEVLSIVHQLITALPNTISNSEILGMSKKLASYKLHDNPALLSYTVTNGIVPYLIKSNLLMEAIWADLAASSRDHYGYITYDNEYLESYRQSRERAADTLDFEDIIIYRRSFYWLKQQLTAEQLLEMQKQFDARKGTNELQTHYIQLVDLPNKCRLFNGLACKKFALTEQWDKALAILPKTPIDYQNKMGVNPVNFFVTHNFDRWYETSNKASMPQKTSVERILKLASTLKKNADAGNVNDQYLYGTLLYNLSFYGPNHYIMDNHWYYYMDNTPYYLTNEVDVIFPYFENENNDTVAAMGEAHKNYFYLYNAEEYLKKAKDKLSTPELNAQCLLMLAKCWQPRTPVDGHVGKFDYEKMEKLELDFLRRAKANVYLVELNRKFGKTKVAKNVFAECSYYRYLSN